MEEHSLLRWHISLFLGIIILISSKFTSNLLLYTLRRIFPYFTSIRCTATHLIRLCSYKVCTTVVPAKFINHSAHYSWI